MAIGTWRELWNTSSVQIRTHGSLCVFVWWTRTSTRSRSSSGGFEDKVRILICHFHVVNYLKDVSRKPQFGKLTANDHESVDHLCHHLIYAKKEGDSVDRRVAFELTCERLGFLSSRIT
jgi:hypothetical protein